MPDYEYRCLGCRHTFTRHEHLREHEQAHPRCPECGGDKVEQILTPFYARTSRKSWPGNPGRWTVTCLRGWPGSP